MTADEINALPERARDYRRPRLPVDVHLYQRAWNAWGEAQITMLAEIANICLEAVQRARREPRGTGCMKVVFIDDRHHTRTLYIWLSTDHGGPAATVAKLRCELEAAKDLLDRAAWDDPEDT